MATTTEPVNKAASTAGTLPIADIAAVRRHARGLLAEHRPTMATVIGLHALAAIASLAAPRLVGDLEDGVTHGTTRSHINTLVIWLAASILVQTVLVWAARPPRCWTRERHVTWSGRWPPSRRVAPSWR